jgi:hypothetical protein
MYLTRKIKICASVLLAVAFVGMPLGLMTASIYSSPGNVVILPPEFPPIEPILIDGPPVCIMDYTTIIHMTTGTTFNLGNSIDMYNYFQDDEMGRLKFSVEYRDNVANVVLRERYLDSVTTFNEYGENYIKIWAWNGVSQASYDFILKVENRETLSLYEDVQDSFDVSKYMPQTLEEYTIGTSDRIKVNLDNQNYQYSNLEIIPSENWWGTSIVNMSYFDTPYSLPYPRPPLEEMGVDYPAYTYGFFEFDIGVSAVNDPPQAINSETYQLIITADSSGELVNPIALGDLFYDVDSQLQYSWSSGTGLSSINIRDSAIGSIASGTATGYDTLKIIANDGEYVTMFDISVSVIPRTSIEMVEDIALTLDLREYIEDSAQEYKVISTGDILAVVDPEQSRAQTNLSSDPEWFGSDEVSLYVYPDIMSIDPPFDPITIDSMPPGPSIPPFPTRDNTYGIYEFDVNVAEINDPPYFLSQPSITILEDGTQDDAFNLRDCFWDLDSNLVYAVDDSMASHVTATAEMDGYVDISALADWFGTETIRISATDENYTVYQDILVNVLPVNDIPFATGAGASLTLAEDTNLTVHLDDFISDIDSELWFSYATGDTNSTIEFNETTWEMNVVPNAEWYGIIDMVVYGSDGEYEFARNLSLNVTAVNDAPEIISERSLAMTEGLGLDIDLSTFVTDVDSELRFFAYSDSGNLLTEIVDGSTLSVTPSSKYWNGDDVLRILASDGEFIVLLDLDVETRPVNFAPMQTSQPSDVSTNEDSAFFLAVDNLFTDVDGDMLTYTFDSGDNLQLEYNTEYMMLTITPDQNWSGESSVSVYAGDGELWSSIEIPVSIAPVNDPPYLVSDIPGIALAAKNSTNISISSYFSDIDSYALTIEVLGTDTMEVTPMEARGVFHIQSLDTWEGIQTLTVRVSDGVDVTETQITVSTYIPDVTMETTSIKGGIYEPITWTLFGMAVALALVVTYTASENRKTNTSTRTNKERIL